MLKGLTVLGQMGQLQESEAWAWQEGLVLGDLVRSYWNWGRTFYFESD